MGTTLFAAVLALSNFTTLPGTSYYPIRLEDPKAVYAKGVGNGKADDTAALQSAIDHVQETTGQGIVFLESGRYRITDTLKIWPGIRLIGCGPIRPVLVLADDTPGFDEAIRYMVFFAGRRPQTGQDLGLDRPSGQGVDLGYEGDANPGTFYSALSNVDFEIGAGNPQAVAVRGKYAQHCHLSHIDFRLGSALAGILDTGNFAEDLRFFGGQYGLITHTPSPGWQFTLMDSSFEGQTVAAIRTMAAGLTLIRPSFRNVPTAVSVEPGRTEQLWMSDGRMDDIAGPAVIISREGSLRTQINLERTCCRNVPTFASFRESGKTLSGKGDLYEVKTLSHGLQYPHLGADPEVKTVFDADKLASMPPPATSDLSPLPSQKDWVSVADLGVKGDGDADDTVALAAAIATHRTLYFPMGKYRVTKTLRLKPDTVLIGLHPFATQILIQDGTPAFAGTGQDRSAPAFAGNPVPLLETPEGGSNIVTGIGLDTGGNNPSATAAKWMAGKNSMMQDVKFLGGHGSVPWNRIYNSNHTADPDPTRRWDSQFPSLWITNGGGGTFADIWTASTFAQAGIAVTDTSTEGRIYELSSEHHVRHELQMRNASNWSVYALQTEEESGESPFALPIEIDACTNVLIANLNVYRVISMRQPQPAAAKVGASSTIRFRNIHCNSNSKASFDNFLIDQSTGFQLRQREFANLDLTGAPPTSRKSRYPVEKLAGAFFNISGGAVDPHGDFYFVDYRDQRIYRWDARKGGQTTVSDSPLAPVNLAFDRSGNLVVVSYAGKGTVYSFRPGKDEVTQIKPQPSAPRDGKWYAVPVTDFDLNTDLTAGRRVAPQFQFVSPDGSVAVSANQDFLDGATSWGVKSQPIIRSFGLALAKVGDTVYLSGENNSETYSATLEADGSLSHGKLFAEQGGEGLAVGPDGNIYLADGQIHIYSPQGKKLGTIDVPERPIQVVFGGPDGKALFIAARTSLYAVRPIK